MPGQFRSPHYTLSWHNVLFLHCTFCSVHFPLLCLLQFIIFTIICFVLSLLIDYKLHEIKDQSCSLFCLQWLAHILEWMNEWANAILVVWRIIIIDSWGILLFSPHNNSVRIYYYHPFTGEEAKIHRCKVTCPGCTGQFFHERGPWGSFCILKNK